jgi:sulfate adenylyltransferase subunit 1 (EFTu-like GTPase family)
MDLAGYDEATFGAIKDEFTAFAAKLPSGLSAVIRRIDTADGPAGEAFPPMSVTLVLDDQIDISRGDMICRPHNRPAPVQDIDALVCWMTDEKPLAAAVHRPLRFCDKHEVARMDVVASADSLRSARCPASCQAGTA